VQGVPGDVQVTGEGERLPEQGAGFVVGPGVVRAQLGPAGGEEVAGEPVGGAAIAPATPGSRSDLRNRLAVLDGSTSLPAAFFATLWRPPVGGRRAGQAVAMAANSCAHWVSCLSAR
jgi:hypothetical protein